MTQQGHLLERKTASDNEVHELRQWDVVRLSPPVVRAVEAGGDGLELLAIGSDRPDGGDGVTASVEWPD